MRPTMKDKMSVQATKVPGPLNNAKELVVRRVNWKDIKEPAEKQAARAFCDSTRRKLWKLEAMEQGNPVDIRAKSPDGKSVDDLQIVRLWEQADWRKLNTEGALDKCYTDKEAVKLLCKALEHKGVKKYPAGVRKNLTLLIDANPIESASGFISGIENAIRQHAQVGYKSVWVVGTGNSYKID
jgi:hypothetical protein